jgi:hypothetical protein
LIRLRFRRRAAPGSDRLAATAPYTNGSFGDSWNGSGAIQCVAPSANAAKAANIVAPVRQLLMLGSTMLRNGSTVTSAAPGMMRCRRRRNASV